MLGKNQIEILKGFQTHDVWHEDGNWTGLSLKDAKRSIAGLFQKGYLECANSGPSVFPHDRYSLASGWEGEYRLEMGAAPDFIDKRVITHIYTGMTYDELIADMEPGERHKFWNVYNTLSGTFNIADFDMALVDGKLYLIDEQCIDVLESDRWGFDIDKYFREEESARAYKEFMETDTEVWRVRKQKLQTKINKLTDKLDRLKNKLEAMG